MAPERRRAAESPDRVLLIGWDAADWQIIQPLVDQGLMPTTKALLESGAWGNLATTRPILSPMLWNTIATGKRPSQHGVFGFTEPMPDGGGVRPVASTSRKCKALWNILTQAGLRSNVVGWYASDPAEPIHGVMVSNQFDQLGTDPESVAKLPPNCIHPPEQAEELAEFRVHPGEIDASAILPFVPDAAKVALRSDHRLGKLQYMIAQTATIHAVATHLIANTNWDFTALYYEGIDRFGHEFMPFHPPKMPQVSQEEFEAYQHCIVGIYRFHDMLLQTLLKLAGENTAVILMSDHGYYNNHLRPDPREGKSGPVEWHRPFGIFAAGGAGIRAGARAYGASILDIAPTVLQLLGLPAAYDMPGRVLAEVLTEATPINRIESWEEIEGECGMHAADKRVDPVESQLVLQQLAALGYIDRESGDVEKDIQNAIASNQFNLCQSLADSRDFAGAIEAINQLSETVRLESAPQVLLAHCQLALNDRAAARQTLEKLAEAGCAAPRMHMMMGALEFAEGNHEGALTHLEEISEREERLPDLHSKLGEVYLETRRYPKAIDAFRKALEIDPESPIALAGTARAYLELGDPQAALDQAMLATELVHYFPRAHLVVGKALVALNDHEGALEALELCVRQAPKMVEAHEALARVYRALGDGQKAINAELRAKQILA